MSCKAVHVAAYLVRSPSKQVFPLLQISVMTSNRTWSQSELPDPETSSGSDTGSDTISEAESEILMLRSPIHLYRYKPFEDPRTQIRLIKACPGPRHSLSFETSVWDLDDTPQYVAISYTWGEYVMECIYIDGSPKLVRRSARYSLWQVLDFWPDHFIWIDSICINQDDDEEKSHQVAMMSSIYTSALEVAVCLGPHADDSEWLLATTTVLQPLFHGLMAQCELDFGMYLLSKKGIRDEIIENSLWKHVFQAFPAAVSQRILNALDGLAGRPYWRRLWIVQELAAARHIAWLLCGLNRIGADSIYMLTELRSEIPCDLERITKAEPAYSDMPYIISCMGGAVTGSKESLGVVLDNFDDMLCSDPRDRLFGLLSLVDWNVSRCIPILPDYKASSWDIAARLALHCDFGTIRAALGALEISSGHKTMLAAVLKQRGKLDHRAETFPPMTTIAMGTIYYPYLDCFRLESLCSLDMADHSLRETDPIFEAPQSLLKNQAAKGWYIKGKLAAVLCPAAMDDDLVFHVGSPLYGILLVVRRQTAGCSICDLIGQGIDVMGSGESGQVAFNFKNPFTACNCDEEIDRHSNFTARIELHLSGEERLVLVGQDRTGTRYQDVDPTARLLRLATMPSAAPMGAVCISSEFCSHGNESTQASSNESSSDSISSDSSLDE